MDITKLQARRAKLLAALKKVDEAIAKIERNQREAEQRELLKLIKSRGIDSAQLLKILESHQSAGDAK